MLRGKERQQQVLADTYPPGLWPYSFVATRQCKLYCSAEDAADGIGLKISENGGLTRGQRQRDMYIAAGLTVSVHETTGSDIAFAAIVHLGQSVRQRYLRCALECRDMVTCKTADGDFPVTQGLVTAPNTPGLGITPRMDVMGK